MIGVYGHGKEVFGTNKWSDGTDGTIVDIQFASIIIFCRDSQSTFYESIIVPTWSSNFCCCIHTTAATTTPTLAPGQGN